MQSGTVEKLELQPTMLGCIADDYTGATDLAGILARSGVSVSLRMGLPQGDPVQAECAAVEVIALKIRTVAVKDAVAEALAALKWLQKAGATRFFWKYCSTFDSTPAGNIGQVSEALMAALNCTQTIYCPAFPQNGRTVFMGNLFVGEQPLSESPMKDHPLTPMGDSNLLRLLSPQVKGQVGLVNRMIVAKGTTALRQHFADIRKENIAHIVVDAISDGDLEIIAKACSDMPLITGGSAIAMPLSHIWLREGKLSVNDSLAKIPQLSKGEIVLAGSCSKMTRTQVGAYLKSALSYRLNPLDIAKHGLDAARDWLQVQNRDAPKIIYASAEPDEVLATQRALGVKVSGELIENALAVLAVDARDLGISRFISAGGETSGAIIKALDVNKMIVGHEIAPGVPWMYCQSAGVDIAVALKSGNFGASDFFSKAFKILEKT